MISGMAASRRRALATFVAGVAFLCAQLTATPDAAAAPSSPAAIAAPAQLSVARVQNGSVLVKAERPSAGAKQAPVQDMLVPIAADFHHPRQSPHARRPLAGLGLVASASSPYRARAPPAAVNADLSYKIS